MDIKLLKDKVIEYLIQNGNEEYFKEYSISDLLSRVKDPIIIEDHKEYKRVTIRTNNKGISIRDTKLGVDIGTKKQFLVKEGLFLLSKIDARNGAFGIVPMELNDAIITGNFWAYEVNKKLLDIRWFNLFVSSLSFIKICDKASSGTTNRKYLDEKKFLNFIISLPPIKEQKRIVAKIDEVFKLIDELDNNKKCLLDDITNIRSKILQLAIQGKLVKQCENDEPANILLEKIKEEKEQLIKNKIIKKEKPLPEITEEEKIFNIPENWSVVRLGSVINLISGQDFKPNQYNDCNKGIPYITGASSLSNNGVIINRWTEEPRSFARNGDVLLVCKGSGYGTTVICDVDTAHIARQIMAIKSSAFLNMHYVRYFLKANINYIKKSGQGLIPGIDRKSIQEMIFPLPPLKEQNRIVDKVDSIMDYLEKLQKEIELQEIILEDIM